MLNEYGLGQALEHRDFVRAREFVRAWADDASNQPYTPHHLSFVSQYAMQFGDTAIRDLIAGPASHFSLAPHDILDYREGIALTFFHLGVAFLPDGDVAREWFTRSLEALPDFFPARVEMAMLDAGLDRREVMARLGEAPPFLAWQYELAAAQLGLDYVGTAKRAASGPGVAPGIALRGRVDATTPALVRLYRRAAGARPLVLATWDDTDPDIVRALRDLCDDVLLVADPPEPGFQNRARQIVLAQAALDACAGRCDLTLLTRTDIAIFRHDPLAALTRLWRHFPCDDQRLRGRLIVPHLYTRRYVSDHPSDMIIFDATADLQRYWATSPFGQDRHRIYLEQYLARTFRVSLNLGPEYIEDRPDRYMEFLRDYMVVRDFSWFEAWWVGRRQDVRVAGELPPYWRLVSQAAWEDLYYADRTAPPWAPSMRGALVDGLYPRGR